MKYLFTFFLLIAISCSFAYTNYFFTFLSMEPSAINFAMGGNVVGVVNVWPDSPLTAYANPAIAAFHEGLSYGSLQSSWPGVPPYYAEPGLNDRDDYTYSSSLINVGYRGIGLTFSRDSEQSSGLSLAHRYPINEGSPTLYGNSYQEAKVTGLAINPLELIRTYAVQSPLLDHFDLALGVNKISHITMSSDTFSALPESHCTDLGGIAKVNFSLGGYVKLEGVYGLTYFNYYEDKTSFNPWGNKNGYLPLYTHTNEGFALSASLSAAKMIGDRMNPRFMFYDNLFTYRYLAADIGSEKEGYITGRGQEFGFLDTIFLRTGYNDNDWTHKRLKTKGVGINLHYKDLVSYGYNYASMPGNGSVVGIIAHDHSVKLDFISIFKLVRNSD